jgi:xanthine dehydrogenase accessory factor
MTADKLLHFFTDHRDCGLPLVLVTVIDTEGSTYSKTGEQMLINEQGVFRGMLSGGCLEGDLAARARVVLESGKPQIVTYDLASDDELWGLGVGCDGQMRVVLQPCLAHSGYAPFAQIAEVLTGHGAVELTIPLEDDALSEFRISVEPPPRILVLGAGLDAEPLVRIASEMGWRCTVVDHRPAYIDNGDFRDAVVTQCIAADDLAQTLDLSSYDMAVVMSHNLTSDRSYLAQLAETDIPYIGLLGPAGRRQRLLQDIDDGAEKLGGRLYGPAGLELGGRGPAPIALAIVAQMQKLLAAP